MNRVGGEDEGEGTIEGLCIIAKQYDSFEKSDNVAAICSLSISTSNNS